MKTKLSILVLCAASFCTLVSCDKKTKEPDTLLGTQTTPIWSVSSDNNLTSSMTAVISVDLTTVYTVNQLSANNYRLTEEDMLAAFSGNQCLGVTEMEDNLFYLYISAPADEEAITFKYYSSALKKIFVSDEVPFANDTQLGTPENPFYPIFVTAE